MFNRYLLTDELSGLGRALGPGGLAFQQEDRLVLGLSPHHGPLAWPWWL